MTDSVCRNYSKYPQWREQAQTTSRYIGLPLKHVAKDKQGWPVAFTWRGVTYRGKVIST